MRRLGPSPRSRSGDRPRRGSTRPSGISSRPGRLPDSGLAEPSQGVAGRKNLWHSSSIRSATTTAASLRSWTRRGRSGVLSRSFATASGLAWHPSGEEVWFTSAETGARRALRAVTLSGAERELLRIPESLALQDVASDGRRLWSPATSTVAGVLGETPGREQGQRARLGNLLHSVGVFRRRKEGAVPRSGRRFELGLTTSMSGAPTDRPR